MISNLSEVNLRDGLFLSFLRRFWFRSVHFTFRNSPHLSSSSHSSVRDKPLSMSCNVARLSLLNAFIADIISTSIESDAIRLFQRQF